MAAFGPGNVRTAENMSRLLGTISADAAASVGAHPIQRGRWAFAYDGESDGELLFAYVLTEVNRRGLTDQDPVDEVDELDAIVRAAVTDLARRDVAVTFLLSDGAVLYAHRFRRPLWFVERRLDGPTVAIASEPLTDEAWSPLEPSTLLRCARTTQPDVDVAFLVGSDPREPRKSDIELPFTD